MGQNRCDHRLSGSDFDLQHSEPNSSGGSVVVLEPCLDSLQQGEESSWFHVRDVDFRLSFRQISIEHGSKHRAADRQDVLEHSQKMGQNRPAETHQEHRIAPDQVLYLMSRDRLRFSRWTHDEVDVGHVLVVEHQSVPADKQEPTAVSRGRHVTSPAHRGRRSGRLGVQSGAGGVGSLPAESLIIIIIIIVVVVDADGVPLGGFLRFAQLDEVLLRLLLFLVLAVRKAGGEKLRCHLLFFLPSQHGRFLSGWFYTRVTSGAVSSLLTNRTRASLKLTVFLRQLCSLSITIVALWLCRCHSNVFSPPAHLKSVREVLVVSEPDLQKMTGLSRPDVQELLHAAATACRTHQPITALQLQRGECRRLESGLRLGTGCPVLDQLLRGGLPVGGVVELAGESGAGKTQLGLQLCLSVQYPVEHGGLSAGALYVCTEDPFPVRRLQQLISEQTSLRSDVPPSLIGRLRFSDNIYVEHAADLVRVTSVLRSGGAFGQPQAHRCVVPQDSLQVCLSRRAALLLAQGRVRLVVVDSVAALFRCEFRPDDWLERNKQLLTISSMVHHLSHEFSAPILCINQVTDVFHQSESSSSSPSSSVSPALGLAWANQVTVRLMMCRLQATVSRGDQSSALRKLEVVFAPHLARGGRVLAVWREGLRGVLDPVLAPFGPDVAQQEKVLPLHLGSV
ncbi:hypothetical protein CCH79_00020571 [Gambusia affinis]|uniref:RecA family profile 1 domain-containing protein n=1 Tax=Gambusia affinis TaxID=33528 RepID=A0A315VIJ4_GAMAF|nr:hypothetical protein CCH79_00020571 [Gambusia affinis]